MSIEIRGADQLATLAKALRQAGEKDLQRELGMAINRAVRPVKDDLKASALARLPRRGGLAAAISKSKFTTRRRTSAKVAGVRVVGKSPYSLYHLNQGVIRHGAGKDQKIRPGWWTEPTEKAAPEIRAELLKAMDDIARKIGR